MKRRTLLQTISAAAIFPGAMWTAALEEKENFMAISTVVYELRVYHAAPGKLGELLGRFREYTMKLFAKHGIKSVAYWTPVDEPGKSNTLIYLLEHPSGEAAVANWKAFQEDAEWKNVKEKSEANGKLVEKIDSTYMAMTDFSPQLG
jgi:hypothetical protein